MRAAGDGSRAATAAGAAAGAVADSVPAPRPRASTSLKRLLAGWLLLPLIVLVPLATALQYRLTLRPALESLDHALGDSALALANLVRAESDGDVLFDLSPQTERSLRTDRYDTIFYAVLAPDGRRVAGDVPLGELALPRFSAARAGLPEWHYADAVIDGAPVRVTVLRQACGQGECQIRVAETTRKRDRAQRDALLGAALSMGALALLLVLLTFVAIRRGLAPLARVREELAQRSLDHLQPLESGLAPAEVQPLMQAINQMLERLRGAADAQRAFVADAAHQLRTPLTALRTEAELVLLEPHPPALTPSLTRLAQSSARAARLAGQLLALARAEAPAVEPATQVDLKQLAQGIAAEWVPRALEAGVDLGFDLEAVSVRGRAVLLQELLANLLHNALEYAGRGARVTVRTGWHDGAAILEVEDNGPGIAPAERARVFERFVRGSQPRGDGSGLGLAIVRDIANGHGATVALLDGAGRCGLRVRVRFPAPG